jgi:hypothetical protein
MQTNTLYVCRRIREKDQLNLVPRVFSLAQGSGTPAEEKTSSPLGVIGESLGTRLLRARSNEDRIGSHELSKGTFFKLSFQVDMLEAEVEALKTLVITSTPSKPGFRRRSTEQLNSCDSCGSVHCMNLNNNVHSQNDGKSEGNSNAEKEVLES